MKFTKAVAIGAMALAGFSISAQAQSIAAAGVSVGVTVYGPQGNEVGKVERIDGDIVTINTGKNAAALNGASFAKGMNGPVIGYTKAQLDEAIEAANQQAKAKLDAVLVAGNALRGADGVGVGTIKTINDDGTIVIDGSSQTFSLNRDLFSADDQGPVLRISSQQLQEALAKSAATAPAAPVS